jgi:O-antigen ligase
MDAKLPRSFPLVVLAGATSLAAAAALALILIGVNSTSIALTALIVAPLALYFALDRPLDFPLGLYILLIPFDLLLQTGSVGTLTKLLGMVAGGFLLLWVARRRRISLTSRPAIVLLALMLWMLASSLWALEQGAALSIMSTYAGLMGLYIVLTMMPVSPAQFRRLLFLVGAGGVAAAIYGIHAFYADPTFAQTFAQQTADSMRLIVSVGNTKIDPNVFSDSLLLPIAVVAMWGLRSRRPLAKLISAGAVGLLVLAILYSGSREGISATFCIAGYYIWRSRYRFQVTLALATLIAGAVTAHTSVWLRFATAMDSGGSGRTSIWAVAVEAAKHRLLQGYGIGNFGYAYDLFYLGVHQLDPYGWESPAHNLVLHYMVELGVIGLALIAAFFVTQFLSLRVIPRTSDLYDYRIALEAALLATVIVSMTVDLFTYKYAWLTFSMIALLRNAYAYQASAYQANAPMRATSSRMIPARSSRRESDALPASPSLRNAALSREAS